jgi:hypothetical protein
VSYRTLVSGCGSFGRITSYGPVNCTSAESRGGWEAQILRNGELAWTQGRLATLAPRAAVSGAGEAVYRERQRLMAGRIRFLDDVLRQLADLDENVRHQRRDSCVAAGSHRWRELETHVVPPALYCERCLLVSLKGLEFWPMTPTEKDRV